MPDQTQTATIPAGAVLYSAIQDGQRFYRINADGEPEGQLNRGHYVQKCGWAYRVWYGSEQAMDVRPFEYVLPAHLVE